MTDEEWEQLCDGCGRCCLHKLEDADDGAIYYTRAACELLDIKQCRCTDYPNRLNRVETCVKLTIDQKAYFNWLPPTCAYRLLAEGETLPWWHPLVSGRQETVKEAGVSVAGIAKPISEIDLLEDAIVLLPEPNKQSRDES